MIALFRELVTMTRLHLAMQRNGVQVTDIRILSGGQIEVDAIHPDNELPMTMKAQEINSQFQLVA